MRKFAILLVIVGIAFLSIGGYEYFKSEQAQKKAFGEAQEMLTNRKDLTTDFDAQAFADKFNPTRGQNLGMLSIPKLDEQHPIVQGTDFDDLLQGVGHYTGTAYPLQNDQIVLSGHRDTVFPRMGELEIGDILTLQMEYGDFSYEIVETKIVDANDLSIIVPTSPDEVLTVTTCYPFTYVGYAPDRYIINAVPVDKDQEQENTEKD